MVKPERTSRDLVNLIMLGGIIELVQKQRSDATNLIVGYIQIDLRGLNLKQAIADTDFLMNEVNEVMCVFNVGKELAEKALVVAFEREAKERKAQSKAGGA